MNTEECGSLLECCWKHWSPVTGSSQEESWTPGRESRVCIWWRPWHSDVSDSSSSRSSSTSTITRCTGREKWWWVWAARAKGWYWTLAHSVLECSGRVPRSQWSAAVAPHTSLFLTPEQVVTRDQQRSSSQRLRWSTDKPVKWGLAPLFNIWNNQMKYDFSYINLNSFNHFTFSQFNWRHLSQLSGASDRGQFLNIPRPWDRWLQSQATKIFCTNVYSRIGALYWSVTRTLLPPTEICWNIHLL